MEAPSICVCVYLYVYVFMYVVCNIGVICVVELWVW